MTPGCFLFNKIVKCRAIFTPKINQTFFEGDHHNSDKKKLNIVSFAITFNVCPFGNTAVAGSGKVGPINRKTL